MRKPKRTFKVASLFDKKDITVFDDSTGLEIGYDLPVYSAERRNEPKNIPILFPETSGNKRTNT